MPDKAINSWHFAFAAACVWELHARRGEREVWFRPKWSFEEVDKVYGVVDQIMTEEPRPSRPGIAPGGRVRC